MSNRAGCSYSLDIFKIIKFKFGNQKYFMLIIVFNSDKSSRDNR